MWPCTMLKDTGRKCNMRFCAHCHPTHKKALDEVINDLAKNRIKKMGKE